MIHGKHRVPRQLSSTHPDLLRGGGRGWRWRIAGSRAGLTVQETEGGVVVTGTVSAPNSVTATNSDTGPIVAGTTATLTGSNSGLVKANGAVDVSNGSVRDVTGSGVTAGGAITVTRGRRMMCTVPPAEWS